MQMDSVIRWSRKDGAMAELKNCPYCGNPAHIEKTQDFFTVECKHSPYCYLANGRKPKFYVRTAAVSIWNTRGGERHAKKFAD